MIPSVEVSQTDNTTELAVRVAVKQIETGNFAQQLHTGVNGLKREQHRRIVIKDKLKIH